MNKQHKASSPQSEGAALKCLSKKIVLLKPNRERGGWIEKKKKKHKNPSCCEKNACNIRGRLKLFVLLSPEEDKISSHTSYLYTELRTTTAKTSGKPAKKKVTDAQKVI